MDWFSTLNVALLTGSALGATLAGFFAYRRGAREKVLSALVGDQEKRIAQLTEDRDELQKRVTQLEAEKQLPLTNLTQLIIKHHSDQMTTMTAVTEQLAAVAKLLAEKSES